MNFFDFLFGKEDQVLAPYQSDEAKEWKKLLADYAQNALGSYKPSDGLQSNKDAFANYNNQMNNLMNGNLASGFNDKLTAIRDNNLQLAQNQIDKAANSQVGGLLTNLAGKGVINSSVTSDSMGQIGKSAANAMQNAALQENNNYNQSYLNGLGAMGSLANQTFGNNMSYSNQMQNQAMSPFQYLYGIEQSLQPIVKQGSPGLLGTLAGGLSGGLGSSLGLGFGGKLFK